MPPKSILWVLALSSLGLLHVVRVEGTSRRTVHRLVGGHLSVLPELDDAELIITSSAGGGRDGKKNDDGEEKKTLSQQVADGKYGLIQKELFSKPAKRPGVLSYDANPDIPKDNINSLGGLSKGDIWLAENHLLVIKGGAYPAHEVNNDYIQAVWTPIDDYKAPSRQVKIPANPKVPPPFPVQLTDNGPLQILGTNSSTTINGSFSAAPYPLQPPEGEGGGGGFPNPYPPDGPDPANATAGQAPVAVPPYPPGAEIGGPFSPFGFVSNGSLPPYFASLPPGAVVLPPPGNVTEYDEDDPSIYYPPPYSFYYQMDNSTQVPPGPLVPGIVLPPPPNFFAPLDEGGNKKKKSKGRQRPKTTTTTETVRQIHGTTTPLPPTVVNKSHRDGGYKARPTTTTVAPQYIVTILPARYIPTNRTHGTTTLKSVPHRLPDRRKRPPSVTILKPVKPEVPRVTTTTQRPVYFYENNEVNGRPFKVYGPRHRTAISSTQIPLKAYFSTSNDIDTNSVTQLPDVVKPSVPSPTTKQPAQYYFYEEEPVTNSITTPKPVRSKPYFNEYYVPKEVYPRPQAPQPQQQYYFVDRPNRPSSRYRFIETTKKPDTFRVHVARLKQQIHQYYTTQSPYRYEEPPQQNAPKPVYQFSFQAANYQQQQQQQNFRASPIDDGTDRDKFRPMNKYNVQIQPAIEVLPSKPPPPSPVYYEKPVVTTARPEPSKYYSSPRPPPPPEEYEYEEVEIDDRERGRYVATPSPISQYSFQATQNPIYQPYYTKQEEPYFDDITKKYFTIFGKKIPGVTTPITPVQHSTPRPQIQIQYAQPEYITNPPQVYKYQPQPQASLHSDVAVNYKQQRPRVNPDAEIIRAVPIKAQQQQQQQQQPQQRQQPGSFISYELPGDDGAHFYFLTPQLAQRRDQGAGFYYETPNARGS